MIQSVQAKHVIPNTVRNNKWLKIIPRHTYNIKEIYINLYIYTTYYIYIYIYIKYLHIHTWIYILKNKLVLYEMKSQAVSDYIIRLYYMKTERREERTQCLSTLIIIAINAYSLHTYIHKYGLVLCPVLRIAHIHIHLCAYIHTY